MGNFNNWSNEELGELVESLDKRNDELLEQEKKAWNKAARNWQSLDIVLGLLIDQDKAKKELEHCHKIIDELQDALFEERQKEEPCCGTPAEEVEVKTQCDGCIHFHVCKYKAAVKQTNGDVAFDSPQTPCIFRRAE